MNKYLDQLGSVWLSAVILELHGRTVQVYVFAIESRAREVCELVGGRLVAGAAEDIADALNWWSDEDSPAYRTQWVMNNVR